METTLCFLKPEVYETSISRKIGGILPQIGNIDRTFSFTLNESILNAIYGHLDPTVFALNFSHLNMKIVPVCIVSGPGAIQKMVDLVGRDPNPNLCSQQSLRFVLNKERRQLPESGVFFRNFIHCPKNEAEALSQLKIFGI